MSVANLKQSSKKFLPGRVCWRLFFTRFHAMASLLLKTLQFGLK